MRGRRRRMSMDAPELNLVPLLDMVSLLIQLLLINAQFGVYGELATALGSPSTDPGEGLQLQIHATATGFEASWTDRDGAAQGRQYTCPGERCAEPTAYDGPGLTALADELDELYPDAQQVQVRLDAEVPFEVAAMVMDAMRGRGGDAFPDVVLGGP
jgi:biopolymer transport protein ExbD